MKRLAFVAGILLVVVGAGAAWWFTQRGPAEATMPFRMIMSGSRAYSADFGLSGGNLAIAAGKPGVCYGTTRFPGQQEKVAYVILFRCDARDLQDTPATTGIQFNGGSDGKQAHYQGTLTLFGKALAVQHKLERDVTNPGKFQETLVLGEQPMDLAAGRVFLLDLSGAAPVYRQVNVPLPDQRTQLDSLIEVEREAENLAKYLQSQSEQVRAFLQ